jgi:hypothetical protein
MLFIVFGIMMWRFVFIRLRLGLVLAQNQKNVVDFSYGKI